MSSYYDILNVNKTASQEEIKKAYRVLSLKWHPDRNQGSDESNRKSQEINKAYEVLSDSQKRHMYDRFGTDNDNELQQQQNNPFHGIRIFHNGGGGGGQGQSPFDIFNFLQQQMNQQHQQHIYPIVINLEITLEQAYNGCQLPIEVERQLISHKKSEQETIYVQIPQGIDTGEIILLQGKGHCMEEEDRKGDVKIVISVKPAELIRQGMDLIYNKTVTLKEALLGFSFDFRHINGKSYSLHNRPTTDVTQSIVTPGFKRNIPNLGMIRANSVGQLWIVFDVQFPTQLTNDMRELLKTALP